jgi:hypothetical protein
VTARITGFLSRAELGMRLPDGYSRNIDADADLTLHYGAGATPTTHAKCIETWLSYQTFHMDTRTYADIAYNFGFCNHGYVFAGRGLGVRSGANGTDPGNQSSLAACWIGGSGTPTQAALDAADWIILSVRRNGGRSSVKAHRDWKQTTCPGEYLTKHARSRSGRAIEEDDDMPSTEEIQAIVNNAIKANIAAIAAASATATYRHEVPRAYDKSATVSLEQSEPWNYERIDRTDSNVRSLVKQVAALQGTVDGITALLEALLAEPDKPVTPEQFSTLLDAVGGRAEKGAREAVADLTLRAEKSA